MGSFSYFAFKMEEKSGSNSTFASSANGQWNRFGQTTRASPPSGFPFRDQTKRQIVRLSMKTIITTIKITIHYTYQRPVCTSAWSIMRKTTQFVYIDVVVMSVCCLPLPSVLTITVLDYSQLYRTPSLPSPRNPPGDPPVCIGAVAAVVRYIAL